MKRYDEAYSAWKESPEKGLSDEWEEEGRKEFVESLLQACVNNGVEVAIMRKPGSWNKRALKKYGGDLAQSVKFLEVTEV